MISPYMTDGTPIQQSLLLPNTKTFNVHRDMLGVILEVQLADHSKNRTAMKRSDLRGYAHTATVYIIEDGAGSSAPLKNVIITPDSLSGADDFAEHLPKGTSMSLIGERLNTNLNGVDPFSLDGEFCIVRFIGGHLNSPYIARWWPHPHNVYDPATSGQGNPTAAGNGTTLPQGKRKFSRINGVEHVITKKGDIYLSTTYSNSPISPTEKSINGRVARRIVGDGGSVRVWIKPTQTFEMTWSEQEDGIGVDDLQDASLPQTNPRPKPAYTNVVNRSRDSTYVCWAKSSTYVEVPEYFSVLSHGKIGIEADGDYNTTVGGDATTIVTGDSTTTVTGAATTEVTGDVSNTTQGDVSNNVAGDLSNTVAGDTTDTVAGNSTELVVGTKEISAQSISLIAGVLQLLGSTLTIGGPSAALPDSSITIGDPTPGVAKKVITETFVSSWVSELAPLALATNPAETMALVNALLIFLKNMGTEFQSSQTSVTKLS